MSAEAGRSTSLGASDGSSKSEATPLGTSGRTPSLCAECAREGCDNSSPLVDGRPDLCDCCGVVVSGRGLSCFCGQPDDRERVHRAHECVPWVSREAGRVLPRDCDSREQGHPLYGDCCHPVAGRVSSPHDQCHAMAAESYDHGFADGVIEARKDAEVHCDCGKSYVGEECFRDYDA